jgi:flagellar basal-body rod protein FlgC
MLDAVESNIQALGALSYAVDIPARNIARTDSPGSMPVRNTVDAGPAYINSVAQHTEAFTDYPPPPPFEIANDQETGERAWNYANTGGQLDVAREMVNLVSYERAFQANAAVIRTTLQTTGSILDLIA